MRQRRGSVQKWRDGSSGRSFNSAAPRAPLYAIGGGHSNGPPPPGEPNKGGGKSIASRLPCFSAGHQPNTIRTVSARTRGYGMNAIARGFLVSAVVYGLLGMLLGLQMGISHNHGQMPTHAHIMVI